MGAPSVLRPLAGTELQTLVGGFDWDILQSRLTQALPGGKGRHLREMGRVLLSY
jgi:hypothetical protein